MDRSFIIRNSDVVWSKLKKSLEKYNRENIIPVEEGYVDMEEQFPYVYYFAFLTDVQFYSGVEQDSDVLDIISNIIDDVDDFLPGNKHGNKVVISQDDDKTIIDLYTKNGRSTILVYGSNHAAKFLNYRYNLV